MDISQNKRDSAEGGWLDAVLPSMAICAAIGGVLSNDSVLWTAFGAFVGIFVGLWARKHDQKARAQKTLL